VVDLVEALKMEKDARVKERILAVKLVYDGFSLSEAARIVGRTKRAVFNWVRRFREGGIEALRDKPRSGRPRKASRDFIAEKLRSSPRALGYNVDYWTVKLLRVELAKEGVEYSLRRLYRIVKELGYRLIKPRPRHYRAEGGKWADFKKSWRVDG
jgi:putative transposase